MNANLQSGIRSYLKPVPCSGRTAGLHSIRKAADDKGKATSWLQKLNTKRPTGNLNKFIKPICFLSLFRTNCKVQDKEMTLVSVSSMMWMYNLIWLVGKAESPGPSSPVGPKTWWILNWNVTHAPSPLQLAKAGSLGKQEHTPWEDRKDLWMQNKNY